MTTSLSRRHDRILSVWRTARAEPKRAAKFGAAVLRLAPLDAIMRFHATISCPQKEGKPSLYQPSRLAQEHVQ